MPWDAQPGSVALTQVRSPVNNQALNRIGHDKRPLKCGRLSILGFVESAFEVLAYLFLGIVAID